MALAADNNSNTQVTYRWILAGTVQGVGFRPFVYRLAGRFGLAGWVQNQLGQVIIVTRGDVQQQERFARALIEQAPPLAVPRIVERTVLDDAGVHGFFIKSSTADSRARISVPLDLFVCDDCLRELDDPSDRRYHYPFINCTQCGPRYTLIGSMPYDRANTSMAGFMMCARCRTEYSDPNDRRFHAEPIACPDCGPRLKYVEQEEMPAGGADMTAAVRAIEAGRIVAVKGIGGYHLMCDARNEVAVARLRSRKHRPHKPLAVMFPVAAGDPLHFIREEVVLTEQEAALVSSPARPIVLAGRAAGGCLPDSIAPGLDEIGVFLPYSPLHYLLLRALARPLVATSGNVSGEPVLTDNTDVERRLGAIADCFLHHDRPIVRPADDPVYRSIASVPRPIRLGRGVAPLELSHRIRLPAPVLAVGAHLKNNISLALDQRIVIGPHIGDMGSLRSLRVFEQAAADLPKLYGVEVAQLVCDAHPDYQSSRWARRQGLPLHTVWHHHAHASAASGPSDEDWLVLTWDGVGLGEDGTLWGGELLHGRPGRWQRVGTIRSFALPGGDRAAREPWRCAASVSWETSNPNPVDERHQVLRSVWERGVNSPRTSAVGRLLDAVAALLGVADAVSYEAQAPMRLEALARDDQDRGPSLPCTQGDNGVMVIDWAPLIPYLRDGRRSVARRAHGVHAALARAAAAQIAAVAAERQVARIGVGGGVFQNRLLVKLLGEQLQQAGFELTLSRHVPVNDAGVSYGQIVEYLGVLQQSR